MKKSFLVLGCGSLLLFARCKEHDTPIDFNHALSTDTTYVLSSVPATAPHQVLIEEFTGQSCANCPAAHDDLENQVAAHPGLINFIGLYIYGNIQSQPPNGSAHDFEDSAATQIANSIYGSVGFLPSGGVDRITIGGNLLNGPSSWDAAIASQLSIIDSVNLSVSSAYNTVGMVTTATITTIVSYTQNVSTSQNLSIALVEDSMVDIQEDNAYTSLFDPTYLFTSVFRGMITNVPSGDPIMPSISAKVAGQTERKIYTYILPTIPASKSPAINPAHCRIIAYISGGASTGYTPIWQSAQCPLGL